jgi:hypothetical protein
MSMYFIGTRDIQINMDAIESISSRQGGAFITTKSGNEHFLTGVHESQIHDELDRASAQTVPAEPGTMAYELEVAMESGVVKSYLYEHPVVAWTIHSDFNGGLYPAPSVLGNWPRLDAWHPETELGKVTGGDLRFYFLYHPTAQILEGSHDILGNEAVSTFEKGRPSEVIMAAYRKNVNELRKTLLRNIERLKAAKL